MEKKLWDREKMEGKEKQSSGHKVRKRITEWLRSEGISRDHLVQLHAQEQPPTEGCLGQSQTVFEYLQGCRRNLPGQPVPMPSHSHSEKSVS